MFYETWGALLERADEVLRDQVRDHVTDPQARDRLDAVAAVLGDLASMWPQLFAGLERENQIFEAALRTSGRAADERVIDVSDDPLQRHRDAVAALNERVNQARELPEPERSAALHQIRNAIVTAADVQGAIVQGATARAAQSTVRRI